jgi:O-antigen ligase
MMLVAGSLLIGGRLSRGWRLGLGLMLAVGFVLHAAILKRSEAVGLLVGGFLVFSFYGWRRSAFYGTLGALAVVTIALMFPGLREHFESAADVEETKWHYALPYAGWVMFKDSPIVGQGTGSFSYTAAPILARQGIFTIHVDPESLRAPHNLVARIASETGLVGLLLFGIFVTVVLWTVWRASRAQGWHMPNVQALARGFLGASCLQLMVSLAENVDNAVIFWIILAMGYRAGSMLLESPAPAQVRVPPKWVREEPEREFQPVVR